MTSELERAEAAVKNALVTTMNSFIKLHDPEGLKRLEAERLRFHQAATRGDEQAARQHAERWQNTAQAQVNTIKQRLGIPHRGGGGV
jgi:hypothetical protein